MADSTAGRRRRRLNLEAGESAESTTDAQQQQSPPLTAAEESTAASQEAPAAAAEAGQRRRRRQQQQPEPETAEETAGGTSVAVATAAVPQPVAPAAPPEAERAPDVEPSSRSSAGGTQRSARRAARRTGMPSAFGGLPDDERRLLEMPVRIDKADIYPSSNEPHFLIEPPAPALGEVQASYIEVPGGDGRFVRGWGGVGVGGGEGGGAGGASGSGVTTDLVEVDPAREVSGGTQLMMLLIGVAMHSAQGALAGACLMQLGLGPWPNDDGTLVRPMAYASLAVPMTRAIHVVAVFAFVGVADLHVSNPRVLTGLVLWMYTLIVITLVLEIPTVVAVVLRRAEVEGPLQAMLDAAIFNSSNATWIRFPFEPEPLLPTQASGNGTDAFQPFSTGLTVSQPALLSTHSTPPRPLFTYFSSISSFHAPLLTLDLVRGYPRLVCSAVVPSSPPPRSRNNCPFGQR